MKTDTSARTRVLLVSLLAFGAAATVADRNPALCADEPEAALRKAAIDGNGPG